jgi:hypothetical protein
MVEYGRIRFGIFVARGEKTNVFKRVMVPMYGGCFKNKVVRKLHERFSIFFSSIGKPILLERSELLFFETSHTGILLPQP